MTTTHLDVRLAELEAAAYARADSQRDFLRSFAEHLREHGTPTGFAMPSYSEYNLDRSGITELLNAHRRDKGERPNPFGVESEAYVACQVLLDRFEAWVTPAEVLDALRKSGKSYGRNNVQLAAMLKTHKLAPAGLALEKRERGSAAYRLVDLAAVPA